MSFTDDETELLAEMRALIARWGPETFVAARIVEPTDAFFPDRYTPDLRGVRTVARRLLRYAGLGELEVDVIGSSSESEDPLAATSVFLSDVDASSIELTVDSLGASDSGDVPLVLAHEVARAHRSLRVAPAHGSHPYRAVALHDDHDDGHDDRDDEDALDDEDARADAEHEVALTACYLGFGVLVTKGGHFYRATGGIEGNTAITRWAHHAIGGISPDEACFHLAAQAVVRRMVEPARAWARHLPPNQAALLTRELDALEGREDELAQALGLPPREEWPEPRADAIEPLPDDDWEPPEDDDEEEEPAHLVFRRHRDTAFNAAAVAGVASAVGVLGAAYALPATLTIAALVLVPIVVVIAYRSGKRLRRRDLCSGCDAELDEDATCCPRCAGVLSGEIRVGESIFDAEERAGLPTFGGREAGADAAAGAAPGNKCPHCGFRPDGTPHWECGSCDGDAFDPFETDGSCPACEAPVEEALCPTCKHVSPYEFWCG